MALAIPVIFTACKQTEEPVLADKTQLQITITQCDSVYNAAIVGTNPGQYKQADKDAFKVEIDLGKTVLADTKSLQTQVDAINSNLKTAKETFIGKVIPEISAANLVAYWKLDGNGDDASGNNHNGVLKAGTADRFPGSTLPTASTDRRDVAGKALHFENGANIEVPYSDALNPNDLSITFWFKTDNLIPVAGVATQYVMSNNKWENWKVDLPTHGKMAFTRAVSGGIYNADTNPVQTEAGIWYQVGIVATDSKVRMFLNGTFVVEWPVLAGKPVAGVPTMNFIIGSFMPNSATWPADTSWFTSFYGSLDDIRIYNKGLSDSEVGAIYGIEKP